MKKVKLIIFDLDGTLVDSKHDIAFAANSTLAVYSIPSLPEDSIARHVGYGIRPLLEESVAKYAHIEFEMLFQEFSLCYENHLLDSTRCFAGVEDLLNKLGDVKKVVLTNKRLIPAKKIVEGLNLRHHFLDVFGRGSFEHLKPHPEPVEKICAQFKVTPQETVIVGDTSADIRAGKSAGTYTCGVSYGYGKQGDVQQYRPDVVIDKPEHFLDHFMPICPD